MTYKTVDKSGNIRITGGSPATTDPWPVNSIYISLDAVNPSSKFGGTWVEFSRGRMLIGIDPFDANMNAPGDTGGSKTQTLSVSEMPPHTHAGPSHTHSMSHSHGSSSAGIALAETRVASTEREAGGHYHTANNSNTDSFGGSTGGNTSGSTGSTGSGDPFETISPYTAVYIWRRTA